MLLKRWEPFAEIRNMSREMDRVWPHPTAPHYLWRRPRGEDGDDWKHADQLDQAYADQEGARSRWYSYGDRDSVFGASGVSNHDFFADIFAGREEVRPSTARYPVQLTPEEASSKVS